MTMSDKDYTLPKNTLYSQGQLFGWRANYDEALGILGLVHEIIDVDILFDYYSFPDSVMEEMASWSLKDLVLSALFCYLETVILNNKKRNSDFLTTYNWKKITTLILNSGISSDVLQFIEDVDLRKCSSDKIIISGGQKAIENLYNLDKIKIHKIGLINLLVFLKYGLATSELLVNEALENKSVANIIALLSSFEGDLDKKLILTTILQSYQNYKDQEEMTILIKKSFDEIYKSQIIGSEDFNIFDMFESSENFKARTPQIMFSLFCQDLFKDLIDDKISNSLLLFELFEEYLISSKDRIFLFKNLSLKSLKDETSLRDVRRNKSKIHFS